MADNLPSRRIDREALDRIIKRAAELQAGEMDTGEALTEQELLKLGADVGIDGRFLRQALYEQGAPTRAEHGMLARWLGPGAVAAGRVVAGERAELEDQLAHWMAEGEALTIKRRMPERTVWERQKGFFAEMRRGFGVGGRSYMLSRAVDVSVTVTQLEPGYCHVELVADISQQRGATALAGAAGAGLLGATGVGTFALLTATGGPVALVALVAAVPLAAGGIVPAVVARVQRRRSAHMQLALEQVLDRLEHGEIKPRHREAGAGPFLRIAEDIRRSITDGIEQSRRSRRLPPGP